MLDKRCPRHYKTQTFTGGPMPKCCKLDWPHAHATVPRLTAAIHMNDPDVPAPIRVTIAKEHNSRNGDRTGELVVTHTDHAIYDLDGAAADDLLTASDADAVLAEIEEWESEADQPDYRDTYNAAFFGVRRERR
jgi:hypothetical protein